MAQVVECLSSKCEALSSNKQQNTDYSDMSILQMLSFIWIDKKLLLQGRKLTAFIATDKIQAFR
jgi:hypothetical protein